MKVVITALLAICTLWSPAPAQQLEKLPNGLQQLLDKALSSNPEILVAEARLAEAEAELRRLQLRVTQDVVSLNSTRKTQASNVDASARQLEYSKKLHEKGMVDDTEIRTATSVLVNARGKLEEIESQLRYTCGLGMRDHADAVGSPRGKRRAGVRPTYPQALVEKLRMPISVSFKQITVDEIASRLSGAVDGFSILVDESVREYYAEELHSLFLDGEIPLEGVLTALHDKFSFCAFVLREYGALMTSIERAERMRAATIPDLPIEYEE